MNDPPASLKWLLRWHELSFLLLVLLTAVFGGLALYSAQQHAAAADELSALRFGAQRIEAWMNEALRDATHATATGDPAGRTRWREKQSLIHAEFELWLPTAAANETHRIMIPVHQMFAPIEVDIERLFRGSPREREVRRLRLLGPAYRETTLAAFQGAVRNALDRLRDAQQGVHARLAARMNWLLLAIPVPLVVAVLLVVRSRGALERKVLVPVQSLRQAATAISEQQLAYRAPVTGAREMCDLAVALNRMAEALRQNREALDRQARQAALGALVPVVAHNIRNPLASIRANAQLLEADSNAEELAESRQVIMETVDRLERWVRSLLSYLGPIEAGSQRLDLRETLDVVLGMLRHEVAAKRLQLRIDWPPEPAVEVRGDAVLCEQMLNGLLLNAVEAAPTGSKVEICWQPGLARLSLCNAGRAQGFEPRATDNLRPGPTTKARGTGLGIPFAFKVCEVHGWGLAFDTPAPDQVRARLSFRPTTTAMGADDE